MSKIKNFIDRMKSGEDIGLDRNTSVGRQRTVNEDGSYNITRKNGKLLGTLNPYHWVITSTWTQYWFVIFGFYFTMNIVFATIYFYIGVEELNGVNHTDPYNQWLSCLFFSAQSFTTVGYGGIHPVGIHANFVAIFEAFIGLMTFALATGTLYGRFSRPVSKIKYSKKIIIAPYKKGLGLQFMVANELSATLMEMEAKVNISWNDLDNNGNPIRKFQQIKLEIDKISMFPVSWVINHPIDEESALYQKTLAEINEMDFEVFIVLKGFDEVFSQYIYTRHSYMPENFIWGAKFKKPFYTNDNGKLIMDITKVGEYDLVSI